MTDETSALAQSPQRLLRWCAGAASIAAIGTRVDIPEVAVVALAVAAAASASSPVLGLLSAMVVLVGATVTPLGLEPLWVSAALAGGMMAWSVPWKSDGLDVALGSLTSLASATLASGLLDTLRPGWTAPVLSAVAVTAAGLGMMPVARRRDHPDPPSPHRIRRLLDDGFRGLALRASVLYSEASSMAPSAHARRQLHALATAAVSLQQDRQRLQHELDRLDPSVLEAKSKSDSERVKTHALRMLTHYDRLTERSRRLTDLAEMAVDHLEEARASFALGTLANPAETTDTARSLLEQIRHHSIETEARHKTAHELAAL